MYGGESVVQCWWMLPPFLHFPLRREVVMILLCDVEDFLGIGRKVIFCLRAACPVTKRLPCQNSSSIVSILRIFCMCRMHHDTMWKIHRVFSVTVGWGFTASPCAVNHSFAFLQESLPVGGATKCIMLSGGAIMCSSDPS